MADYSVVDTIRQIYLLLLMSIDNGLSLSLSLSLSNLVH